MGCLFQCGYPKVQHLLDGSTYLRPGTYYRKYGTHNHIKNVSKKKATTKHLLTYINKSLTTNCNKVAVQTKNLIDENLILFCENNKLVDDEMPAPLPGMSDPLNKDTNKISHIILMILRKTFCDINGKVENLKSLTDNKYTIKMVYQNFKEKMLLIICEL